MATARRRRRATTAGGAAGGQRTRTTPDAGTPWTSAGGRGMHRSAAAAQLSARRSTRLRTPWTARSSTAGEDRAGQQDDERVLVVVRRPTPGTATPSAATAGTVSAGAPARRPRRPAPPRYRTSRCLRPGAAAAGAGTPAAAVRHGNDVDDRAGGRDAPHDHREVTAGDRNRGPDRQRRLQVGVPAARRRTACRRAAATCRAGSGRPGAGARRRPACRRCRVASHASRADGVRYSSQ